MCVRNRLKRRERKKEGMNLCMYVIDRKGTLKFDITEFAGKIYSVTNRGHKSDLFYNSLSPFNN